MQKLACLLTLKYGFIARGEETPKVLMTEIKKNIVNAFNLYVNADTAKEPVLQMLANAGEPYSAKIVAYMNGMVARIDELAGKPLNLFNAVNKILGVIDAAKNSETEKIRDFIHNSVRAKTEKERNYRERLKSKVELMLHRISSILEKQAIFLQGMLLSDTALEGGSTQITRQELSKEKILMFMRSPAAQFYGLDDMDVITNLLQDSEMRGKITSLINAIDRGHTSIDAPEVMEEASIIKNWLDNKATNVSALEEQEDL